MFRHPKQKVLQIKHQHFYPALSKLKGRILEIGFGNGESLDYYPSNCKIFALEKSDKKIKARNNSLIEYQNVKLFKGPPAKIACDLQKNFPCFFPLP